ncbi:hypothetical protein [Alteriqipengyuania sp.]|uniref:hypothetical protein n=1 Tax=Alteriqipengyuania sp. TaxID=2800692 RepID=UPI00355A856D
MNDLILQNASRRVDVADFPAIKFGRSGKAVEDVAREICEGSEAFDFLFAHADTGGRAQQATATARAMAYANAAADLCGYPVDRCFPILPKKEMEAWALTDASAVCQSLGFAGDFRNLGLPSTPRQAEALADPKLTLRQAIAHVKRRVRPSDPSRLLASIAQIQDLARLRQCASYLQFENALGNQLNADGYFR